MFVNEKVYVTDYDANWKCQFADEREILSASFPYAYIEHVGSTSVEGMAAKPIIDILLGIHPYPPPKKMVKVLNGLGYNDFSEATKSSDRTYFIKRGINDYNIHITEYLGDFWFHMISLRDYLRTHQDDALNYSELKKNILNSGVNTMLEYSEEKGDFLFGILKKINGLTPFLYLFLFSFLCH